MKRSTTLLIKTSFVCVEDPKTPQSSWEWVAKTQRFSIERITGKSKLQLIPVIDNER